MDETILKAVEKTASDYAEVFYPESKMGWILARKEFIRNFILSVKEQLPQKAVV